MTEVPGSNESVRASERQQRGGRDTVATRESLTRGMTAGDRLRVFVHGASEGLSTPGSGVPPRSSGECWQGVVS